jgi:hypothetical protein
VLPSTVRRPVVALVTFAGILALAHWTAGAGMRQGSSLSYVAGWAWLVGIVLLLAGTCRSAVERTKTAGGLHCLWAGLGLLAYAGLLFGVDAFGPLPRMRRSPAVLLYEAAEFAGTVWPAVDMQVAERYTVCCAVLLTPLVAGAVAFPGSRHRGLAAAGCWLQVYGAVTVLCFNASHLHFQIGFFTAVIFD